MPLPSYIRQMMMYPQKSKKTSKTKTEKVSRKRKSTALDEPTEAASEPANSVDVPIASPSLQSENEPSQEPPSKKRKGSVEEIEVDVTAPEPPSKKALRRLKKGKPLPPSKSGAESTPEP